MDESAVSAWLSSGAEVRSPRDLDDLMDGLAEDLPPYARSLIEALRRFRVTSDLRDVSPSITREAAHHIERLEAENLLLARIAASRDREPGR